MAPDRGKEGGAVDGLEKLWTTGSRRIGRQIDTAEGGRPAIRAGDRAGRRSARARERQLIASLPRFAASRAGRLPTVAQVRPYGMVGVSPSKYLPDHPDPPCVRRDVDDLLDDLLERRRFALLVDESRPASPAPASRRCAGGSPGHG
jgi:hypothetical protein